jgi:hypothetical protein
MPDTVDEEVLRRFIDGHRDAFEALFWPFERDVSRWILRIVREIGAAEDGVIGSDASATACSTRRSPARRAVVLRDSTRSFDRGTRAEWIR